MVFIGRIVERDAPPNETSGGAGSGEEGPSGGAGRPGHVVRAGGWRLAVSAAMPFVEGLATTSLPSARTLAGPVVAAPATGSPAAASAWAAAPEDRADEREHDEQEEQRREEAEETKAAVPAVAVAVRGDHDRGDHGGAATGGRHGGAETGLVGSRGDEAATDRQDGNEQDGGKDARHEV